MFFGEIFKKYQEFLRKFRLFLEQIKKKIITAETKKIYFNTVNPFTLIVHLNGYLILKFTKIYLKTTSQIKNSQNKEKITLNIFKKDASSDLFKNKDFFKILKTDDDLN
jgi:hypothetical protein